MRTSEKLENLIKALIAFQKEDLSIFLNAEAEIRTKSGYAYKFRYATLPNIMNVIRPLLLKHGLILLQPFSEGKLKTILIHESGEFIETEYTLPIQEGMDKQVIGSLITYFRRYMISSLLGLVAEEDDDANIADGNAIISKKENKPVLTPEKMIAVKAKILKGDVTLETVLQHFTLTQEQIEELKKIKNDNKSNK